MNVMVSQVDQKTQRLEDFSYEEKCDFGQEREFGLKIMMLFC